MLAELSHQAAPSIAADFHRPSYHFLPPSNWMNDPNGFIHWQGDYHLFYQYNPTGATWGNMHWGHTVSPDLIRWRHLPIALLPSPGADESGCFSGCAVDDDGVPTFIYTGWQESSPTPQTQCVATSRDGLLTWEKHPRNPVLSVIPPEAGQNIDFRDPFVWREGDTWWMVLGSRQREEGGIVFLYRSADLVDWEYLGPLFEGTADRTGYVWECPNFFPLGDKWVLMISAHPLPGQTNGFVYYFVGDYANHRFTPLTEGMLDYGAMYAPLTTLDVDGRRLLIGWIREQRSTDTMTLAGWSGAQSIPRVLTLDAHNRLQMKPVDALSNLATRQHHITQQALDGETTLPVEGLALDLQAVFKPEADGTAGLIVACAADGHERTEVIYRAADHSLTVATHAPGEDPRSQTIPHRLEDGEPLELRLLLDGSVLEIIANGRTSLVHRIYFSSPACNEVRLTGKRATLLTLDIREMASIW
jgi:beta-fructofuranosidase